MSGHSKWNNIKNKKGKEDARRAKIFTKLGRYIMVASREGGPNPDFNPQLKAAIDKAKAENMPNDNIDRAIKKGSGENGTDSFETVVYEGYGPSGIAIMVHCLTDNRNRTAADVRHIFDKFGGNMGTPGCVSFMFDKKGLIAVERTEKTDEETIMIDALDSGAEDIVPSEEGFEIFTLPDDYAEVRDELEKRGYEFAVSEITYIPQNFTEITDDDSMKMMVKLIDALEDNDDVQEVYHNCENMSYEE